MNYNEEIDFILTGEFVDRIEVPDFPNISKDERELRQYDTYLSFFPIRWVYVLYTFLSEILKRESKEELIQFLKNVWFFSDYNFDFIPPFEHKEPVYRFVQAIMLNKIDTVRRMIGTGRIETGYPFMKTLLLYPFFACRQTLVDKSVDYLTPLTLSAILGRTKIFNYLINKGADPGKFIALRNLKPYTIGLSVNECLLMNGLFHWYKSDRKNKIPNERGNELLDSIILASQVCPSLVSKDHLIDNTIRVTWYWTEFKQRVEDVTLLNRLIPLNPPVIRELLDI